MFIIRMLGGRDKESLSIREKWRETQREFVDMSSKNTFVPTVFRHTLIYAASRKLAATLRGQCSSGKAKYIEKPLHSLSFFEDISTDSLYCVLAKTYESSYSFNVVFLLCSDKICEIFIALMCFLFYKILFG